MTLKEKYKDYFLIGAAVNEQTVDTHKELILREFNSITCENEMKYGRLAPDTHTYNYAPADKIYNFAHENGLSMRFHTLLWHNQAPPALFEMDRDRLLETFCEHIDTVAKRYGEGIYACDVANEVIEDTEETYFRKSKWLEIVGEDFVDIAFKKASEAMPGVTLVYNDYNECNEVKSHKIARLVSEMKDRGIPVDCLGLQCHWNILTPRLDDIKRAFELYAKLGVKLHVTELDVSVFGRGDESKLDTPTPGMLEAQAKYYGDAFAVFRQYKDILESVTFWGVADDVNWLDNFPVRGRKNWPLLFDVDHKPKEAYNAIMDF